MDSATRLIFKKCLAKIIELSYNNLILIGMKTSNTSAVIGGTLGVLFGILLALSVAAIFGMLLK